jgi:ribosomal protein S18 acetylase RimI-like enzyme
VQIRPARPDDAAAVAEVHTRTWQAAYEDVFGVERLAAIDARQRLPMWERAIPRGGVTVAEVDGGVVGFVSVGDSREAEGEGELYAIYVLPDAWGSGAAPALMRTAVAALRERHPTAILWVLADNPRARRFYEREGWSLDGGTKTEAFLGVDVTEVRYRIRLA